MTVRDGLGAMPAWRERPREFLTLHEVNELLRRAALACELVPYPEHFSTERRGTGRLRLDWAWFSDGDNLPVAVFEIEGVDAHARGLDADARKLEAAAALAPDTLRVLVLFHLDKHYERKGRPRGGVDPKDWVRGHVEPAVEIAYDHELMAEGGIERICTAATRVAQARR